MSFKRILALVLALTMCFSIALPGGVAFADGEEGQVVEQPAQQPEGSVGNDEQNVNQNVEQNGEDGVNQNAEQNVENADEEFNPTIQTIDVNLGGGAGLLGAPSKNVAYLVYVDGQSAGEDSQYETIAAAIADAGNTDDYGTLGTTITLLKNATLDCAVDKAVSINLNGKTLTVASGFGLGTSGSISFVSEGQCVVNEGVTFDVDAACGANYMADGNDIVEARTITIDPDNGAQAVSNKVKLGTVVARPETDPGKEGHTFVNWFEFDGTAFAANAYNWGAVNSNLTIKAKYTVNKYNVYFKDGETTIASFENYDYGTEIEVEDPTKEGKVFDGWEPAFSGRIPAANTTYVAKWADAEAQVDGVNYKTLDEALAVANGKTVKLLANVETGLAIPAELTTTIDLNGQMLTVDPGAAGYAYIDGNLTITGSGNVTVKGSGIAPRAGGKLTVNGGVFEATGDYMFYLMGGELVINGGLFTGGYNIVNCYADGNLALGGIVTINNGTFTVMDDDAVAVMGYENSNITIVNGTFNAPGENSYAFYSGKGSLSTGVPYTAAHATISGGTFNAPVAAGDDAALSISDGNFTLIESYDDAVVTANSDQLPCDADQKWVAQSTTPETYKLVDKEYVAEIDGQGYETLADAIAAADDGDTVTLLKDVGSPLQISADKNFTLDLNGKTLTVNAGNDYYDYIRGTLTINDSSDPSVGAVVVDDYGIAPRAGGKLTVNGGSFSANGNYLFYLMGGELVINDGTFSGGYNIINCYASGKYAYGGTVTINNGTFTVTGDGAVAVMGHENSNITIVNGTFNAPGENSYAFYSGKGDLKPSVAADAAIATISGGTFSAPVAAGDDASLSITGGTFNTVIVSYDDAVVTANSGQLPCDADQKWVAQGTTPETYKLVDKEYVAEIGEKKYESLDEAIDEVTDGQTIKLVKSTGTAYLKGYETYTLDLGGFELTADFVDIDDGDVTITNGVLTGDGYFMYVYSSSDTTAEAGSYSKLTIASDAVVNGDVVLWGAYGDKAKGYGAQIDVNGKVNGCVFVSGNITAGNDVVNVTGEINSGRDIGIALNGYATLNILPGANVHAQESVANATGIEVRAGVLNVSGGTITGKGEYHVQSNTSGTTSTGAGVAIVQHTTHLPISATLSGASITGAKAIAVESVEAGTNMAVIEVAASKQYIDEQTVVPAGYCWVKTETADVYRLAEMIAKIDDEGYASLRDAIAAAEDGDVIELVKDDEISFATGGIIIDKNLTIDGKDFTVKGLPAYGVENVGSMEAVTDNNVHGFYIKSGDVTIKNLNMSQFGNEDYVNKFGMVPILTASNYSGALTLSSVSIDKFNRQAVCINGGTFSITGGTFNGNATNMGADFDQFQQPIEIRGGSGTIEGVTVLGGSANANAGTPGAIVTFSGSGNVTIKDVNVDFTGIGIWADGPSTKVTGEDTSVKATEKAIFVEDGFTLNVEDGVFEGVIAVDSNGSKIAVSGGYFDEQVPMAFCAEGYMPSSVIPEGQPHAGKYTVVNNDAVAVIETAGGDTQYFATLAEAVAAIKASDSKTGTIKLLKNVEGETLGFNGGTRITLDLNGFELTPSFLYVLNGELTVTNGTIKDTVWVYPLDEANSGMESVFTLEDDAMVEAEYGIVLSNLDGAKKGYDGTINVYGTVYGNVWVIGNITEGNSVVNVTGTVDASGKSDVGIALNGFAKLNVFDGAVVKSGLNGVGTGIEVRAGELNVNGGTIYATGAYQTPSPNGNGTTTVGAAVAVAQHTTKLPIQVNLNGGTLVPGAEGKAISVADPQNNGDIAKTVNVKASEDFVASAPIALPEGYCWVPGTEQDTCVIGVAVAAVYNGETYVGSYATLAAAVDAAQNGNTIKLLADIELDEYVELENVNVNLNGHNVTATNGNGLFDCYGTVKIFDDSTGEQPGEIKGRWCVWSNGNANITLESIIVTSVADGSKYAYGVCGQVNGTLTIKDALIRGDLYGINIGGTGAATVTDTIVDSTGDWGIAVFDTVTLTVEESIVAAGDEGYGISTNGNPGNGATVNIIDSGVNGGDIGVYQPSGTVTVSGDSTITGKTAIYQKSGTLTINGGIITGNGDATEYDYNGNGANPTGDAIVVDSCNYPNGKPTMIYNGGTVTVEDTDAKQIGYYESNDAPAGVVTATSNALTVPADYKWVDGETAGTYKLVAKEYVAQVVGGEKFETLAEAIEAADANDTIVLLKDVVIDETGVVSVSKKITLDMDSKTLTYQPSETVTKATYVQPITVTSTGDLTITGNGTINGPEHGEKYDGKVMISVKGTGKLYYENGTLTATGSGSDGMYGVYVNEGGTAVFGTANGGPTITSHFAAIGENHMHAPATITVNGGTYTANAAPTNNEGWYYFCAAIYAPGSGRVTINGGTFNGYYGISDRYADVEQTLTINGGTFNASSLTDIFVDEVNGSGSAADRTIEATTDTLKLPEGYIWFKGEGETSYRVVKHPPCEFDYEHPEVEWATIAGVYTAVFTYKCKYCEDVDEERVVPTLESEVKGVRTYKAVDPHNVQNVVESQYVIKYTVKYQGSEYEYSWGEMCILSAAEPVAWLVDGVKVADGVNTYRFAVIRDMEVTTEATSSTEQVAAVAASMSTPTSGMAIFDAMWTIPENASIKSVKIYRGSTSTDRVITADTLKAAGTVFEVPLTVRNGSYSLKLTGLTATKYQHAVIVIEYTQGGETKTIESAVQKIQPNGQ